MTEPAIFSAASGASTDPAEPAATALCPCGHPWDQHDRIAERYCRATAAGGLDRGCFCLPEPVAATPRR